MQKIKNGFLGAGGIARAHAYSLQAGSFYDVSGSPNLFSSFLLFDKATAAHLKYSETK